jgi:hypothetical protein
MSSRLQQWKIVNFHASRPSSGYKIEKEILEALQ